VCECARERGSKCVCVCERERECEGAREQTSGDALGFSNEPAYISPEVQHLCTCKQGGGYMHARRRIHSCHMNVYISPEVQHLCTCTQGEGYMHVI
jgi:hypothetical protein